MLEHSHTDFDSAIDVGSLQPHISRTLSHTLVNSKRMKVVQVEIPAGREVPEHSSPDECTIFCLSGRVLVGLEETQERLRAGQLLLLEPHKPHFVRALVDAIVLVTMRLPDTPETPESGAPALDSDASAEGEARTGLDDIDQGSLDSFPASDPPAWTPDTDMDADSSSTGG